METVRRADETGVDSWGRGGYNNERGDVAQLGERCLRTAEVGGSNPLISTNCQMCQTPFRPTLTRLFMSFSSSTATKTVEERRRAKRSSAGESGSVLNMGLRTGT